PLPRPGLRRGGNDHHALRHGGAEPDVAVPPRHRGAAPDPEAAGECRPTDRRVRAVAAEPHGLREGAPGGQAGDPRLDLDAVILALNCGSSSLKYAVFDGEQRI